MFRSLKFVFAAALVPAVLSCTAEQPNVTASSPPCDFIIAEHETPKLATYANELNIPYDQEKLVKFMWVDLAQSECYAKQFAPVKIYRVPYTDESGEFATLPEAPQTVIKSWESFEVASGNSLKGLTTFNFESGKNEKIVQSYMLVRADATAWHLWHEFSHFIIGAERAGHHDQNLQIAEQAFLDSAKKELNNFTADETIYSQKLQNYFNNNHEYITKRFLDEITIEATLIFLTRQNSGTPKVHDRDVRNALDLIMFFSLQMGFHIIDTTTTIQQIKSQHALSQAQLDLLNMYEERLKAQKSIVDRMIMDATTNSQGIPF